MSAQSDEAMRLLREIHAMLTLLTRGGVVVSGATAHAFPSIAPDADLDGQWGDPIVKAKSPRDWSGDQMTGRKFSECPPEYLDLLAARFDFFNTKETDEKKRGYNMRDAARARGWAARLRAGWKPPASASDWAPDEMPQWGDGR